MPGILDGRLRDDARSAGRTSSPDFFRTIDGRESCSPSSTSSSSSDSGLNLTGEVVPDDAGSKLMLLSVVDRECEILRASRDRGGRESLAETVPVLGGAMAPFIGLFSSSRLGEPDFLCCMPLIANCRAFTLSASKPLDRPRTSSSSLELCAESGGDMVIPAGIRELLCGGGDWRRLP